MRKKIDTVFDPVLDYHLEFLESEGTASNIARCRMSPADVLRDMGTVRLGFGRQVGKTTYIARTANASDVILAYHQSSIPYIQQMCAAHNVSGCSKIFSVTELGKLPDTMRDVWVDEASSVSKVDMDALRVAIAGKCRRLILIG